MRYSRDLYDNDAFAKGIVKDVSAIPGLMCGGRSV